MIAAMIVAPLAAMIVQMALSRHREYGADRAGACAPLRRADSVRSIAVPSTSFSSPDPSGATSYPGKYATGGRAA